MEVAADCGIKDKEFIRAKNAAYRALAIRPRSRREVAQRLRDRGVVVTMIDAVLAELERYGYVNDETFAAQWIEGRVRLRAFGRRRIEKELKDKGVDGDTARQSLAAHLSPEREMETAREAASRKLQAMLGLDPMTRRRRLAGYLQRKGFSFQIIRDIMHETDMGPAEPFSESPEG